MEQHAINAFRRQAALKAWRTMNQNPSKYLMTRSEAARKAAATRKANLETERAK
jgi:hypothetical protein